MAPLFFPSLSMKPEVIHHRQLYQPCKKEIQNIYRKKRDEISSSDKMKWDDLLLIQFQTIELPFLNYVLSFYPIEQNNEVNTFLITDYLHFKNPDCISVIRKRT